MTVIKLTAYFFCFIASLNFYVNGGYDFMKDEPVEAHHVLTFDEQVEQWAEDLDIAMPIVQVTETVSGNCLAVAVELQSRIVATGRMAVIPYVEYEDLDAGHVLVMYDSDLDGRFDSVIDNGYVTNYKVLPRETLDNNLLGKYTGTCLEPDLMISACGKVGLRI